MLLCVVGGVTYLLKRLTIDPVDQTRYSRHYIIAKPNRIDSIGLVILTTDANKDIPVASLSNQLKYSMIHIEHEKLRRKKERKCNDLKCVRKPTKSRLSLTHHANKSSR